MKLISEIVEEGKESGMVNIVIVEIKVTEAWIDPFMQHMYVSH